MENYLGLIEMALVFAVILGIADVELVCLRLDKKRKRTDSGGTADKA